jgi:hypothetical protein
MVRKKNVLATMAQSLAATALVSILWVAFGYSLAFTGDGAWLGSIDRLFLRGLEMDSISPLAKSIPEALFMIYQMTAKPSSRGNSVQTTITMSGFCDCAPSSCLWISQITLRPLYLLNI